MEIMKFGLSMFAAVAFFLVVDRSYRDYYYNAGLRDAFNAAEASYCNPGDSVALARYRVLFSNAFNPNLRRLHILAQVAASCALGFCVGGYFTSLL